MKGDTEKALEYYQQSRQISERLGDLGRLAYSHGQTGQLLRALGRYEESFLHGLTALKICIDLKLPRIGLAMVDLKAVLKDWGWDNFAIAWERAVGGEVPDFFKDQN